MFEVDFDYPAADHILNALLFCLQWHFNFVAFSFVYQLCFIIWVSFCSECCILICSGYV